MQEGFSRTSGNNFGGQQGTTSAQSCMDYEVRNPYTERLCFSGLRNAVRREVAYVMVPNGRKP